MRWRNRLKCDGEIGCFYSSANNVPAAIRARADDCTARLCRRREALAAAGKSSCKANAAVARELACWVWEIGCRAEGTLG